MGTSTPTVIPAGTWVVDQAHSRVEFQVKYMGVAIVRGTFRAFEGTLEIGDGFRSTRMIGAVDVASVDTNEPKRDAHLRSSDFFDAELNPQIVFESTSIAQLDDEELRITGDLTMHGVTREITLHADVQGIETDPSGNERVGLEISGQLNRDDYGMRFNQALGSGNVLVSDKVKLVLDVSAIRQP